MIAPTMDGIINFKQAEKMLVKNGFKPKAGAKATIARIFFGAIFGALVASSSSGSSWTSMALTGLKMNQNGKKLKEKGIITEGDNISTYKNMMEYEAYMGKKNGITFGDIKGGVPVGDWTIGSIGGAAGLFVSANPYVQALSFGVQGCSETLTACGYQLAGKKIRTKQIDKEKHKLVESTKNLA